ncbi:(d)CMP kinase [Anaerolinea thermophila]|uniref:Cytidylate kinase n=1 Tax=Anaerolinea thermophila (strain DSM 14523 / JCM 11388 / NBRC 100420 / UNI-1) TaxID=926569 RepID=E8N3V1_ANATU|nr:(d)CMP kinase [Anaerolinea thermophila]BAJ63115.1 cytidylate kinase [Anaerolinea thermophila UNI-1]
MNKPKTIAIDGPAASGKSTIAEKLANELGYLFFDTGVMYRAVTLAALRRLGNVRDEQAVTRLAERVWIDVRPPSKDDGRKADVLLDGEDVTWAIRSSEVDAHVSIVSAYPGVRAAMTRQQRRIGERGEVVMVGRDIGTVVLPEAELKIYLDASLEERARRRYLENKSRGMDANYDEILENLRKRDEIDSTREVAPLRIAGDAHVVMTDGLTIEEVMQQVRKLAHIE